MKRQITLRTRIVVLVVAAIVPLFALAIFNAWLSEDLAISRATATLNVSTALVAGNQDQIVTSAYQILLTISNAPGLVEGKKADCQRFLETLKNQLPMYRNLGLIGLDGHFLCDGVNSPDVFVGDRDFFKAARAGRSLVDSGYLMGRGTGKAIIVFALPVLDREGKVSAVAFAALDLDVISQTLANMPLLQGEHVAITDRQGIVLAGNSPKLFMVGQQVPSPMLQDAVKTMRTGVVQGRDAMGSSRIFAFRPSGKSSDSPFFVAVSADLEGVVAPARKQFWLELVALTLLALLSGWMAWMLGGRAIVKPVAAILEATRQLEQGRLDMRIPIQSTQEGEELARIAAALNLMAESLQLQQGALEAELVCSRVAQEKLQDAQRLARIGYWQMDLTTQLISWSDEVYDLFGIDRTQFDGRFESFLQWIHPADRQVFEASLDAAVQAAASSETEIEFRFVTPAAEVRWVHQFCRIHYGQDGVLSNSRSGVIQDITERKNAELAISRSTELLNRTEALANVGGWELELDSMTSYWSEETYRIHELDRSVVLNLEETVDFYGLEARPAIRAAVNAAIQNATPWEMELPLTTAKGKLIWVRTQGRALLEEGKVVRLVGVLQDITGQHEAQAHLRLLETCISRLNDMVMILKVYPNERRTSIVFVNEAFTRQMGYSREEAVGQSTALLHGPKTPGSGLNQIIAGIRSCKPARAELIHYTKSGDEVWVETNLVPLFDSTGGVTQWVSVERNITQRKLAEQALVDSEQRYAALFEAAPIPMWVFDDETHHFMAVNDAAVQDYGYSVAEFLSMTIYDIRSESEAAILKAQLANWPLVVKERWEHRRKDGSLFTARPYSKPVQYAGRSARLVMTLDISPQIQAEKDVQEYLFTLQRAADAAQAITWHQTLEGTMQEIAEQARGVIGAHQAVVSLSGENNHSPMSHVLSLSEKYAAYKGLMTPFAGDRIYTMVCENNRSIRLTQAELEAHPRWPDFGNPAGNQPAMRGCLAVPFTGRDGKNIGLLQLSDKYDGEFTKQDEYVALELGHLASTALENSRLLEEISQLNAGLEQKVAERTVALARQEALFRALAEQAPQTVWTASPDGAATYCNRAWFDLMGGELKDWIGFQWLAVVHPEDVKEIKANWKTSRANKSPYAGIRRLLAKDGSYHTMAYRATPVFDDQGELAFWVGIDADITEFKTIEAALRLSNQELEAFSYSVSHDLRSPLNTVDGFSRLLAKQLAPQLSGEAGEKLNHYMTRIRAGVAQMGQLIEDLLSLSQVTRAPLHTEPVDLSNMARRILAEWQSRQPERQVMVHIDSGLQAEADERLIRVVMENLLSNAWKFTSHTAQAEISVGQKIDAAGLPVFFVKDNGAGFDMAYSGKLFKPFERLHAVAEFSGTGIGLATVSRAIKRHDGCIWAESAPTCGATFFFTLPQVRRAV
ncbi:MAG: PAS domain S-box protein [Polaromonas sp.]